MAVILGKNAWRSYSNRVFRANLKWMNGEPALFVFPKNRNKGGAFVLPLESAHLWAKSNGHPNLNHAIPTAQRAIDSMGLMVTKDEIRSLIDIVLDALPDLVAMPPEPKEIKTKPGDGELAIKSGGKTVFEREIAA